MRSSQDIHPMAEVIEQIRKSGYRESQVVRIYGEEFEILSDPFPNEAGVAVHARSRRTSQVRALQLPATLVRRANDKPLQAA